MFGFQQPFLTPGLRSVSGHWYSVKPFDANGWGAWVLRGFQRATQLHMDKLEQQQFRAEKPTTF